MDSEKDIINRINTDDKFILEANRDKIKGFFAKHIKAIINEVLRKGERNFKSLRINGEKV